MRATRRLLLAVMISSAAAPARAAEAVAEPAPAGTQAGAGELTNALAAYVGRSAVDLGVLTATPDAAGYRLTVDLSKVLATLLPSNARIDIPTFDAVVSPRGDGDWNAFLGALPGFRYSVEQNGLVRSGAYSQEEGRFKGVFSPEIAAFLSGEGGWRALRASTTDEFGKSLSELGPSTFEVTGARSAEGADFEVRQAIDGFSERREFTTTRDPLGGATPILLDGGKTETTLSAKAVRSRALGDLQAFLVANPELLAPKPDMAEVAGLQDDLKARLRAVLPLWKGMTLSSRSDGLSGQGGFGTFKLRSVAYDFSADGLAKDAKAAMGIAFGGLDVVSPLVPAWAKTLVPQDADLRFGIEKLDLATPLEIAIRDFDLAGGPEQFDEIGRKAGEALDASPPSIVIAPSRIRSASLELGFSGALILAEGHPEASFSLEAKGLDQTIETLKGVAETAPEANQTIGVLSIAKGFGQALPDGRVQWVVNAEADGSVKVNGIEIKGPDAAAPDNGAATDDTPDEGIAPDGEVPLDQAPTDDNALPNAPPRP